MGNGCVIYCRVSSERQVREGSGLSSQEKRCRDFADAKGYSVLAVFKDEGVSGALLERAGVQQMLAFLESRRRAKQGNTIVIVDDISRLARKVETHFALRAAVERRGGRLESPSFNFDDTALGEFMETIFASIAQYGRAGNREQVINRQRARLESGFWTFPLPPGYVYAKHPVYKKIAVPDEAHAAVLRRALEGFANGRFAAQQDIVRFLEESDYFTVPETAYSGARSMAVHRLLANVPFYAGFLEYPAWGISRRKGMHAPLITPAVAERISERLQGKPQSFERKDKRDEFILRNFVHCAACGRPLTGSTTKQGRYSRYHCHNQGHCPRYGHTIRRDRLHADFEALLGSLKAEPETIEMMRRKATRVFEERGAETEHEVRRCQAKMEMLRVQTSGLVRRLGGIFDEALSAPIEQEIKNLEVERRELEGRLARMEEAPPDFDAIFAGVGTLLSNPLSVWKSGSPDTKRLVMRVAFTSQPIYDLERGFGTPDLALPYRISRQLAHPKSRMVEVTSESWHAFVDTMSDWSAQFSFVGH